MYKNERIITTAQGVEIKTKGGGNVLNFCANNYLGLSNNPRLIKAAKKAMDEWGFGLSSVRLLWTQDYTRTLKQNYRVSCTETQSFSSALMQTVLS